MAVEIRELLIKTEIKSPTNKSTNNGLDTEQLQQLKKELLVSTQRAIEQKLKRNSFNR